MLEKQIVIIMYKIFQWDISKYFHFLLIFCLLLFEMHILYIHMQYLKTNSDIPIYSSFEYYLPNIDCNMNDKLEKVLHKLLFIIFYLYHWLKPYFCTQYLENCTSYDLKTMFSFLYPQLVQQLKQQAEFHYCHLI